MYAINNNFHALKRFKKGFLQFRIKLIAFYRFFSLVRSIKPVVNMLKNYFHLHVLGTSTFRKRFF